MVRFPDVNHSVLFLLLLVRSSWVPEGPEMLAENVDACCVVCMYTMGRRYECRKVAQ